MSKIAQIVLLNPSIGVPFEPFLRQVARQCLSFVLPLFGSGEEQE